MLWMVWLEGTASALVPVVVDLEWRGLSLGQHVSHGPGVGLAVGLLDDHLRCGLSGYARPGPINPATFTLSPREPYKGQDTLALRSDGGVFGVSLAPGLELWPGIRMDLPVMVGYGGFGFYLVGEDRQTPDGALPSTWEDRLMDGRDSSLGLGIEGGGRVAWAATEHLHPYLAVRYGTIVGYDAFMVGSYAGPSVALGISVGRL